MIELPQYKDWLESESGYRAYGIPIHSEVWRACLSRCKPIIEGLEAEIARCKDYGKEMIGIHERLEKQLADAQAQLAGAHPNVVGAKPLCLGCYKAGLINCSHFDNCDGKWVYVGTEDSARQAIAFQSGREVGHSEARTALFSLEEMEQQIAEAVEQEHIRCLKVVEIQIGRCTTPVGTWRETPERLFSNIAVNMLHATEANRAKTEGSEAFDALTKKRQIKDQPIIAKKSDIPALGVCTCTRIAHGVPMTHEHEVGCPLRDKADGARKL